MMTLFAAAALAAQPAPATPAPAQQMPMQHDMQMGQHMDHKGMDCCKECCDHMDAKHDSEHSEHGAHQQ